MNDLVLVTRNLMDASKVREAFPATKVTTDLDDVGLQEARLIILDLTSGLRPADVVALGAPVVAYGPHVDGEGLEAARDAGCRQALPRSQFFLRLPDFL